MASNIRIVEIPDEFGGERYQLSKMFYTEDGYLSEVQPIKDFDTFGSVLTFIDQVTKAGMMSSARRNEDGTYDL
jgi:hypothetical protein